MKTTRFLAMALPVLACAAAAAPVRAAATAADFQMKTMSDLVDLCTAHTNDQMATAALNFCHGFVLGVYRSLAEGQAALPHKLFCPRQPMPTRNQAIADLVAWGRANPSAMSEAPADGILHYLIQNYPCASQ
jgi:hypothetical protein